MRQGQSKRMRGRGRGGSGGGGSSNGGSNGGGKGPNPLTRSYESNGPDVKIRGTAGTIADKYVQLSRDSLTSGDPVSAENYMQHAEHYYRLLAAAQAQFQPNQTFVRADADDFNDVDFDGEGEPGEMTSHQIVNNPPPPQQQPQGVYQNNGAQPPRAQNGRQNGPREGDQNRQDRPERRDRQEFRRDRSENGSRGEGGADGDRPERGFDRGERPARIDPSGEQPLVGELPAFITGGGAPARAAEPQPALVESAPVVTVEAAAQDDDDQRESGAARGGRRRRYGRSRGPSADEGGEAGSEPAAEPSSD